MSWQAESLALLATGGMLAIVAILALHPRVALGPSTAAVYLVGAIVSAGIGLLGAAIPSFDLPRAVIAFPLVPALLGLAVARRASIRARESSALSVIATSTGDIPVVAPPFGASGPEAPRLLAASPYATAGELSELAFQRPDLHAAIAGNPAAPASLLTWLIEQGEPEVLAAISARRRTA